MKKEKILFHETIEDVLLFNISNDTDLDHSEKTYLLTSIDSENVYWLIKVDNEQLSDDFLNLFKYILPLNVKIIGLLHLGDVDQDSFSNRIFSSYFLLKNLNFVEEMYYSIIIKSITKNKKVEFEGKNYKFNNDKLEIQNEINQIKFYNLNERVNSNYLIVTSFINPLVVINRQNFLMNELYSNNLGVYYPELNIMIPNLSSLYEENINENYSKNQIKIVDESRSSLNYFLKSSSDESNKLECSFLINTEINDQTYFEETNNMFYTIFQEKPSEQIIKSIKICVTIILAKKKLNILDISFTMLKQLKFLLNELYNLNVNKSHTYSLYSFYNSKICPLPFGILYSSQEQYDQYEDYLINQRIYFHKILNFIEEVPIIRKFQLENQLNEKFSSQCVNEIAKNDKFNQHRKLKNVHMSNIEIEKINLQFKNDVTLIQGDYCYYHTCIDKFNDKGWGNGYRALQTLISWLIYNGYSNLEIPNIDEIKNILVYLGQYSTSFQNKNSVISLSDIGIVLSYLIDSEVEVITIKNFQDLENNLKNFQDCIIHYKCPLLLSTDSVFTILGVNCSEKKPSLLLMNHNYTGISSIFHVNKAAVCKWVPISNFIQDFGKMEILIYKTNKNI